MTRLRLLDPRYRKYLVAAAGAGLQLLPVLQAVLDAHVLTGRPLTVVQGVLAVATALGVKQVENARPKPGAKHATPDQ